MPLQALNAQVCAHNPATFSQGGVSASAFLYTPAESFPPSSYHAVSVECSRTIREQHLVQYGVHPVGQIKCLPIAFSEMLCPLKAVVFWFESFNDLSVFQLVSIHMHKARHSGAAMCTVHNACQQCIVFCLLSYLSGFCICIATQTHHFVGFLKQFHINDLPLWNVL